jgi:hypothetical protein
MSILCQSDDKASEPVRSLRSETCNREEPKCADHSDNTSEHNIETVKDSLQESSDTVTDAQDKVETQALQENRSSLQIVPPQLHHLTDSFDIRPSDGDGGLAKKHIPIKSIYPMNEFVVIELMNGDKRPVYYDDALTRADQVKKMLLKDNTDKPKDERDKEHWLVRELVVAAQRCSEYQHARGRGPKYSQAAVDKFLFHLDWCVKQLGVKNKPKVV